MGEETLYYDKKEVEGLSVGMEVNYQDSNNNKGKAQVASLEDMDGGKRVKIVLKRLN